MATRNELTPGQLEQFARRARDAGATPDEVAALREALRTADATPVFLRVIEHQLEQIAQRPRRYCLIGSLFHDGKLYPPRTELVLSPDDARGSEGVLSTHRSAGRFKVVDPAGVHLNGQHHEAGAELDLDGSTADALGDLIAPVVAPPRSPRRERTAPSAP